MMDAANNEEIGNGHRVEEEDEEQIESRELPSDLPRSLDDRQNYQIYQQETEYYDAWQGIHPNVLLVLIAPL